MKGSTMKRLFSALICFSLLLTAVSCVSTSQQPQFTYAGYEDIISEYTDLLTAKYHGTELPSPNTDGMDEREAVIATAIHGIVASCKTAESAACLGYGYKDFDGNGTPELVLLTQSTVLQAIFTLSNGLPILLEANYGENTNFLLAKRNRLLMRRATVNGHIEEAIFYTCRVDGDKVAYDVIFGYINDTQTNGYADEYFQIVDGNRTAIDQEAYTALFYEHSKGQQPGYASVSKLAAPRIHLPLAKDAVNAGLPVADFSSYSAILATYKTITHCLEEFKVYQWETGGYDNLFVFPNDLSYEYYNRLLYGAYRGVRGTGYDMIDLNGDGQDELVLMNEDYRIIAIFTQKDGVPVLVDAFADATCWLDDKGLIHVDNEQAYDLEYTLYDFTSSGEYNLIYSILAAENGNRYLTKDGKTEKITFEKSVELYYDDYCRYTEPFKPNEQTRNVSRLSYTPLTSPTDDTVDGALGKTWHKYAKLEKTSGKDLANSHTNITFEKIHDAHLKVNIQYKFTFMYPDPDRDHYLLSDVTESSLTLTAHAENGVFVFDESGVKGRIEFYNDCVWLIFEHSTDSRFAVGFHCYAEYDPSQYISAS